MTVPSAKARERVRLYFQDRTQRRQQEQSTLEQKLQGHSETASKPPALDELIGKIGRKV